MNLRRNLLYYCKLTIAVILFGYLGQFRLYAGTFDLYSSSGYAKGSLQFIDEIPLTFTPHILTMEYAYHYPQTSLVITSSASYHLAQINESIGGLKVTGSYRANLLGFGFAYRFDQYEIASQFKGAVAHTMNLEYHVSSSINGRIIQNSTIHVLKGGLGALARLAFMGKIPKIGKTSASLKYGFVFDYFHQALSSRGIHSRKYDGSTIDENKYKNDIDYIFQYTGISLVFGIFI